MWRDGNTYEKSCRRRCRSLYWLMEENKHMLYKIAKGYLRTWLTRILINKCMDTLQKEKRFTDLREFPEENIS